MKRYFANFSSYVIFVVLISLSISACAENEGEMEGADQEGFLPFKITSFSGSVIDSSKLRGSVVVINFWASWCGPCKMEAEDLEAVYKKYKDKGVSFVGIAIDDTEKNARDFIEHYKVTYPNALDSDNKLAIMYKMFIIPTTYVLDKKGKRVFMHRGPISKRRLEGVIKKVL